MKMATVRRFAMSLPDVVEQPHHDFASFRVRGKTFATVPPAQDAIHLFVDEECRERALAMYPEWAAKLLWGAKVAGLRIVLADAAAPAVEALVRRAYDTKAAKK